MSRKSFSLRFRIILLSGFWILLALAGTGLVLVGFYQEHIEGHYDAHVLMHMEEMVSAASLGPDGELQLAYAPSDPRSQVNNSGWYWEIRHRGRVLALSPSLQGESIDLSGLSTADHSGTRILDGPDGSPLRVQTLLVPAGIPGEQLLMVASAPMMGITDDVIDVSEHLLVSLALLGLAGCAGPADDDGSAGARGHRGRPHRSRDLVHAPPGEHGWAVHQEPARPDAPPRRSPGLLRGSQARRRELVRPR